MSNWIACAERLPEVGTTVLISDGASVDTSWLRDLQFHSRPERVFPWGGNYHAAAKFKPTHWMPLPDPPNSPSPEQGEHKE